MSFAPLEDILGPIVLTMRGQEFTLPQLDHNQSCKLRERIDAGETITTAEISALFLGDTAEAMTAIGVPLAAIDRALWVAFTDWQVGREAAQIVWEQGPPKKAIEALQKAVAAVSAGD